MKRKLILGMLVFLMLANGLWMFSANYKVALKELPTTDIYSNILKSIAEATGNTFEIQVVPPARAEYLVINNQVDIQFPGAALRDNKKFRDLGYDFSSVTLYKVSFILYTNKNKPVDIQSVKTTNANNYKIEVDPSRLFEFDYKIGSAVNFDASFKKLSSGVIDGVILAQTTGDPVLKKSTFINIKRQLFQEYDLCFVIKKGTAGGDIDKMLSDGVKKIIANGKFEQIVGGIAKAAKYDNWQP
jgi:polar amino acid transport system substrate-binding protein